MGASDFRTIGKGATAREAFQQATTDAAHEYGHGGYTGTIAEKNNFVLITMEAKSMDDADALVNQLLDDDDPRIADKWGSAGAIPLAGDGTEWLFFGWASS